MSCNELVCLAIALQGMISPTFSIDGHVWSQASYTHHNMYLHQGNMHSHMAPGSPCVPQEFEGQSCYHRLWWKPKEPYPLVVGAG